MSQHSLAEASERLPDLVERALAGEGIVIMRDGRPVVELTPVAALVPAQAVPWACVEDELAWLKANRVGTRPPDTDAGTLLSTMRDEGEH